VSQKSYKPISPTSQQKATNNNKSLQVKKSTKVNKSLEQSNEDECSNKQAPLIYKEDKMVKADVFVRKILAYEANYTDLSSPLWIWFKKVKSDTGTEVTCLICGEGFQSLTIDTTSDFLNHIKRHHGSRSAYNGKSILLRLQKLKKSVSEIAPEISLKPCGKII
jgi:hypothetical protein